MFLIWSGPRRPDLDQRWKYAVVFLPKSRQVFRFAVKICIIQININENLSIKKVQKYKTKAKEGAGVAHNSGFSSTTCLLRHVSFTITRRMYLCMCVCVNECAYE